ncbi:MAG: PhnD/SsuA/transferrin family substrate-binding protein, partial [Rhodocyclaceae bacterium]|nr:PhnD/SsuA/transferrin family substrate-binding protein [Rhodocyclaceae bacterium]
MTLFIPLSSNAADTVRLGVLSFRPKAETAARWQPLVDHLNRTIPGRHFDLVVAFYPELENAIARKEVDFVLTQPSHYVLMTYRNGLSAPLVTMIQKEGGHAMASFGGVIFSSAARNDIATLADVRGKTIATSAQNSLGSYQMQAFELAQKGVRLPNDAKVIETGQPQDLAVKYVLEGRADVGLVRTGLLEQMVSEGKLDLKRLKIINPQHPARFPFLVSTRLYPEWPVSALPGVDPELARQVTVALLALPHDGEVARALQIEGFTIPADYHPVDDLLRELRLPPFQATPEFTLRDVLTRYGGGIAVGAILWSIFLLGVAVWLWLTNRSLKIERARSRDSMEKLAASETRHRAVLAAVGEGVYGVGQDGICTSINPAALAMLGFAEEEVLGHDQHQLFHRLKQDGQPYPREECPVYRTAKDGKVRREEEWFLRKDGKGFPVDMTVTALNLEGQPAGTVVAFRDITERKEAELALRKLYLAVEQSPESIIITDLDARIEYVNDSFIQNTGYGREEVIGQNPSILHSGATPGGTYQDLWLALKSGRAWKGEFLNRRKDGSEYVEFAHVAPIRQADGRITHYVAVKADITEMKRISGELERHRLHLEDMVASRTAELAAAKQAAETANRAKSAFLA